MTITWVRFHLNFQNETNFPLTYSDGALHSGKWEINPTGKIIPANMTALEQIAYAQSHDDSTTGPSGTLEYSLQDGTIINISWSAPHTASGNFSIGALGGRAANYQFSSNNDWTNPQQNYLKETSSGGPAGHKYFTATVYMRLKQ